MKIAEIIIHILAASSLINKNAKIATLTKIFAKTASKRTCPFPLNAFPLTRPTMKCCTSIALKAELYANAAPIIIAPIKLKIPQYNKIVTAFDRRIFF